MDVTREAAAKGYSTDIYLFARTNEHDENDISKRVIKVFNNDEKVENESSKQVTSVLFGNAGDCSSYTASGTANPWVILRETDANDRNKLKRYGAYYNHERHHLRSSFSRRKGGVSCGRGDTIGIEHSAAGLDVTTNNAKGAFDDITILEKDVQSCRYVMYYAAVPDKEQNDSKWWQTEEFRRLTNPYSSTLHIVRIVSSSSLSLPRVPAIVNTIYGTFLMLHGDVYLPDNNDRMIGRVNKVIPLTHVVYSNYMDFKWGATLEKANEHGVKVAMNLNHIHRQCVLHQIYSARAQDSTNLVRMDLSGRYEKLMPSSCSKTTKMKIEEAEEKLSGIYKDFPTEDEELTSLGEIKRKMLYEYPTVLNYCDSFSTFKNLFIHVLERINDNRE